MIRWKKCQLATVNLAHMGGPVGGARCRPWLMTLTSNMTQSLPLPCVARVHRLLRSLTDREDG